MTNTPEHGTRYQLRRQRVDADLAFYRGEIAPSRGELFGYAVTMNRADGSVVIEAVAADPDGAAPTDDELRFFHTLTRTTCRGAQNGPWPRWINRWRADSE